MPHTHTRMNTMPDKRDKRVSQTQETVSWGVLGCLAVSIPYLGVVSRIRCYQSVPLFCPVRYSVTASPRNEPSLARAPAKERARSHGSQAATRERRG